MNATLGLEDEAGFTLVSPIKRTWSRRGQTPIFRTSIDHHDRLNVLGVVLVSPKGRKIRLSIKSYWKTITGEEVIAFLKQILRSIRGQIVLVWDRHTIHKRVLDRFPIQFTDRDIRNERTKPKHPDD